MKPVSTLIYTVIFLALANPSYAKEKFTTVQLNHISAAEAIATLKTLTNKTLAISEQNNLLVIKQSEKQSKNLIDLIKKIDQPAIALKLDFIASKRKINFNNKVITYESDRNINRTSQSMMITERQWVSVNTGISIPIEERQKSSDGTESVTTRYKSINQQYAFKVNEVDGRSIIQVGVNASKLSRSVSGAIENTQINTTVIGNTGEWLEITTSNKLPERENVITYSSKRTKNTGIHLYIKITK